MTNETVVNEEVKAGIKEYCLSRDNKGKCSRCRYSIKKVSGNYSEYASCIFANCPNSWRT